MDVLSRNHNRVGSVQRRPKQSEEMMADTGSEFASNVEFPTFDASRSADQFRAFAEKGVEQSKEAYQRIKSSAEWAQKTAETTAETSRAAASELSLKAISALRTNIDAGFTHLESLVRAKSVSEVIELQTSYFRTSFETLFNQGRDMQAAASKAAEDVSKPVKDGFETAMKELKAA